MVVTSDRPAMAQGHGELIITSSEHQEQHQSFGGGRGRRRKQRCTASVSLEVWLGMVVESRHLVKVIRLLKFLSTSAGSLHSLLNFTLICMCLCACKCLRDRGIDRETDR